MLAGYHGQEWTLAQLRSRFNPSLRGLHLGSLIGIARAMGLACRALRTEPELLSALALPAILHWDMNHFVVLERITGKRAILQDPKLGQRAVLLGELRQRFTGVALEFSSPAGATARAPARTNEVSLFHWLGVFQGFRANVGTVLFLSIALEVATLLTPAFLQTVVDSSIPNADLDLLSVLAIAFGLLALMQFALTYARSSTISEISFRLHHHWANKLFGHLIQLPIDFFQRRHVGDVVSRFRAIDKIQRVVSAVGIEVFTDAAVSILLIVVMASYSPLLTALAVSGLAINVALRISALSSMRAHSEAGAVASAREVSSFLETVRTSVVVKLLGLESRRKDLWLNAYVDSANANVGVQRLSVLSTGLTNLVTNIEQIGVVWVGARAAINGELSVGMLLAFLAYRGILMTRSRSILEKAVEFRLLSVDCERLQDIADQKAIQPSAQVDSPNLKGGARIDFIGVSFRYSESEPWVLRNFSFTIEPGDSVAFVGQSGCGKSTIAKLVLGFHKPTLGEVLIDGRDVSTIPPSQLYRFITAVLQDDSLFSGSLFENISSFEEAADLDAVRKAANEAGIDSFIMSLPMQYHTLVGDVGSTLSGGQRQRVLLARAIYRKPAILVLDEATSHLDLESEAHVNAAVSRLGATRMIIAHRQETIASAQRIIEVHKPDQSAQMHSRSGRNAEAVAA